MGGLVPGILGRARLVEGCRGSDKRVQIDIKLILSLFQNADDIQIPNRVLLAYLLVHGPELYKAWIVPIM